jgi:ubiquinone/menaquinone biosynthesis C-methylase UbiE
VNLQEAIAFLGPAVPADSLMWGDFGAGRGTFTEALAAILGPAGTVLAVDRDIEAVRALEHLRDHGAATLAAVIAAQGDVLDLAAIEELRGRTLDGALFANALHFVRQPERVLEQVARHVRPDGRIVVIEYDRTSSNPWVPFPLGAERLRAVSHAAGLAPAEVVARLPSRYHREMYCAVALRPSLAPRTERP